MMSNKDVIRLLLLVTAVSVCTAKGGWKKSKEVDIICSGGADYVKHICETNKLISTKLDIKIKNVLNENGTKIATGSIYTVYIRDKKTVNFLPCGIKENFPNVEILNVINSGLSHLD